MKYLVYIFISIVLSGCSISGSSYVQESKKTITINTNDTSVEIPTGAKQTHQAGGCLQTSTFFENEKVQVDYIELKSRCTWTGLADGYYQDFLRENIKGLQKTQTFKLSNGDLYKFNKGSQYFYLISLYNGNSNLFVVDYTGEIASKVMGSHLSIKADLKLDAKPKKSLLELYQFKGYFEGTKSDEDPSIIRTP